MERELRVFVDINGQPLAAGRLWSRHKSGRESCTFVYDGAWLARDGAFALAPDLPLARGPQNTPHALFGAFSDAAPDSWGEHLMHADERGSARSENRTERQLFKIDYLAGVNDEIRMGALRFKSPDKDAFLSARGRVVPPLIELRSLMNASIKLGDGKIRESDIQLVLDPGSPLGGARPKAIVRDKDGRLLLAKFEKKTDRWPVIRWEAAMLQLADMAGIRIPEYRLETIGQRAVLMMVRFDRTPTGMRIPFMSAMTAIGARDHEEHSYLEIVDVIRQESAAPSTDLRDLWRRIVFNVLASNTDDHLRNHGFLRSDDAGWRLSPAYDMNPSPFPGKIHQLAIDDYDRNASLETAISVAPRFGLTAGAAKSIAGEVGAALSKWRDVATEKKLPKAAIDNMSTAFEHADLRLAISNRTAKVAEPTRPSSRKAQVQVSGDIAPRKRPKRAAKKRSAT